MTLPLNSIPVPDLANDKRLAQIEALAASSHGLVPVADLRYALRVLRSLNFVVQALIEIAAAPVPPTTVDSGSARGEHGSSSREFAPIREMENDGCRS